MNKHFITSFVALVCMGVAAIAQTPAAAPKEEAPKVAAKDSAAAKPAAQAPKQENDKENWGEFDLNAGTTAVFSSETNPLKDNRGFIFNGSGVWSTWSPKNQFTLFGGAKNTSESSSLVGEGENPDGQTDLGEGISTIGAGGFNFLNNGAKGLETTVLANYKYADTKTGTSSELEEYQEEEFMSTKSSTNGNKIVQNAVASLNMKKETGKVWFHFKPSFRYGNTATVNNSESRTMSGQIVYETDQQGREGWGPDGEMDQWYEWLMHWREELIENGEWNEETQAEWEAQMREYEESMKEREQYERKTKRGWAYYNNNTVSTTTDLSSNYVADLAADLSFRDLAGKKGRSLTFGAKAAYEWSNGVTDENSELWTSSGDYTKRTMHYDALGNSTTLGGNITWAEPLGSAWQLTALANVNWLKKDSKRDARDDKGVNEYFSSVSNANSIQQQYDLTAVYNFAPGSVLSFGGRVSGLLNETYSKSKNIEETTGQGDWKWFVTPTATLRHKKGMNTYSVTMSGNSQRPATAQMLPVLDMHIPTRLAIGNIYLKPYSTSSLNASWGRSNPKTKSNFSLGVQGSLNFNPISYARWYDYDKVQYSLPVNSAKPGITASVNAKWSTPIGKLFSFSFAAGTKYNRTIGYQAKGTLDVVDKDAFDYTAFMDSFWGDASGSIFYSGKDFLESITQSVIPSANASIQMKAKSANLMLGASTAGRITRYSLNPNINLNTLDTRLYVSGDYTTPHLFTFASSFAYVFYNGYSLGFGLPEYQWNAEISKRFGRLVVSVKAYDILNQTRSLTHSVTANYEEDTYRLTMGRYILAGLKWDFGSKNSGRMQKARAAAKAIAL